MPTSGPGVGTAVWTPHSLGPLRFHQLGSGVKSNRARIGVTLEFVLSHRWLDQRYIAPDGERRHSFFFGPENQSDDAPVTRWVVRRRRADGRGAGKSGVQRQIGHSQLLFPKGRAAIQPSL
jgi:hypothetical protein